MVVKNKDEILTILKSFKSRVENDEVRIIDKKFPSINIWFFYNEYLNKILGIYSIKGNVKDFLSLYDFSEIDSFYIDAHEDYFVEKNKALNYIHKIMGKLEV